jgi:PAS domain S-box-containing protein
MVRFGPDAERVTAAVLAEVADLPYFRVDAQRNVVEMSPAMERLTGFAASDILGGSCLKVHRCAECLQGCGVFDHHMVTDKRLELFRADGSTVQVRKSGRVFFDDDGQITGAVEVVHTLDESPEREKRSGQPDPATAPEIARIRRALEATRYRRSEAARRLGMSRTTLWRKMREYGL